MIAILTRLPSARATTVGGLYENVYKYLYSAKTFTISDYLKPNKHLRQLKMPVIKPVQLKDATTDLKFGEFVFTGEKNCEIFI